MISLKTPGSTTLLPWVEEVGANRVDGNPDFSGFTEPTLSVLQQAWQEFLDSGAELEVIPDPEPPEPEPDWVGLRADLLGSATIAAWFDGLSAINREDITAQVQGQDTATLADAVTRVDYAAVKDEINGYLANRNIGIQLP